MTRSLDQLAVFADEYPIHAPCIHADPIEIQFPPAGCDFDSPADFMPQTGNVPIQTVALADQGVGKTVQLFDGQKTAGESACDRAAAFGAQIEGEVLRHRFPSYPAPEAGLLCANRAGRQAEG